MEDRKAGSVSCGQLDIVLISNDPGLAKHIVDQVPGIALTTLPCGPDVSLHSEAHVCLVDARYYSFLPVVAKTPTLVLSDETDEQRLAEWQSIGVLDVVPSALLSQPQALRQRLNWVSNRVRLTARKPLPRDPVKTVLRRLAEEEDLYGILLDEVRRLGAATAALYAIEVDQLVLQKQFGLAPDELPFVARLAANGVSHEALALRRNVAQWKTQCTSSPVEKKHVTGALPCQHERNVLGMLTVRFPDETLPQGVEEALQDLTRLAGVALACDRTSLQAREERRGALELLGMASHDLRGALNLVSIFLEVVEQQPAAVAKTAPRARRGVRQALSIIDTLLDVTKVELGRGITVLPEAVDLGELLTTVVENARLIAPSRTFEVTAEGDLHGEWDPARLTQVFTNLVANAQQYATPSEPVQLSVDARPEILYVSVINRGTPIPSDVLHHLFEPMVRGQDAKYRKEGLGLGLYIVQHLVSAHQGRVWVNSEAQTGTVVTVELPRRSLPAEAGEKISPYPLPTYPSLKTALKRPEMPPPFSVPEEIQDARCRDLYSLWLELHKAERLPHPATIPRTRVGGYLQDMSFVFAEDKGGEVIFVFREVGGALEQRLGRPLKGLHVTAGEAEGELSDFLAGYHRALTTRAPDFTYLVYRFPERPPARFERLILPFSSRLDGKVTDLVSIARFTDFPPPEPEREERGAHNEP